MTDTPHVIKKVSDIFLQNGYQLFLVGGSVRSLLLQRPLTDWDFTTDATPIQMQELFPDSFYDNVFGTVGIPVETETGKMVLEVTTFRTEKGYADRRHPESVEWGKTVEADLGRRDFTINAMAIRMLPHGKIDFNQIIDPYQGIHDLQKQLIRAVGDPKLRFKEDALRLMRAIRFASQLGFTIEDITLLEIIKDAKLLAHISQERIRTELMKILASDYPYEGIMMLRNTNLLQFVIPELLDGIGVSQERPGRHHKSDVFTHNVLSLKFCPSVDPLVRFATLIHDIGKPRVASADTDGFVIFHNHEIIGSRMAFEICNRLKFSKKERDKIVTLIRWHMFTVDEHITDAAIRRFIRRVGRENVKDMMDLRIGDRLGGGTQTAESWRLKLFKKRVEEQLAPMPFSVNDLAIDGNDIMKALGIKPGPKIGELLQKLFEEVDEDLEKNKKEYLLQRVKKMND
jgi:tRNA nucleotidyltransferase (CCA-adding enzyme)